ncbi:hypothetical protein niasHT_010670 [Heterodera trifolii]|uniref:TATA-box-binding protein n=1 Tax=Heterodera trifolii TaxID=157864 RepID=A0ABD2LEM0_9BILA
MSIPTSPIIKNCVAVIDLKTRLDLQKIYIVAPSTKYTPQRMNAVIMKVYSPNATAVIFSTGKFVCTGASSESECKSAAKEVTERIQQCGYYDAQIREFAVQNLVATTDVRFHIKLGPLSDDLGAKQCSFAPELFPGLVFRNADPKVSIIVFSSGKINLTGAKSKYDIDFAFNNFYSILCNYKH